jgi:hypothetical protein
MYDGNPFYGPFCLRVRVMVFNTTFNNISVILWQSVLLEEETGVPGENRRPVSVIDRNRSIYEIKNKTFLFLM